MQEPEDEYPEGVELRDFDDMPALRKGIFEKTKEAMQKAYPVKFGSVRLELQDVDYEGPDTIPIYDQKKAILEDKYLARRLRGTFRLYDDATNELLEEKRMSLMRVPYLTERGTFIHGGNEYACFHKTVKVLTEFGYVPIGKIVNEQLKIRVWSYNFDKKLFELQPITGWWRNKKQAELGYATFNSSGLESSKQGGRFIANTLWGTENHKVYTIHGDKIDLGNAQSLVAVEEKLSDTQLQLELIEISAVYHRGSNKSYSRANTVYDIEVNENHNYIANGILVSNSISQQRLLPGVYTRRAASGILETQFNVRRGTGSGFRISFEPESAQYRLKIGQANLHLYSLLHDLGVSDEELENKWGKDILERNKAKYDVRVFDKAYARLLPTRKQIAEANKEEKSISIRDALQNAQINASVAKRNLPGMLNAKKSSEYVAKHEGRIAKILHMTKQAALLNDFSPDLKPEDLQLEYQNLYGHRGKRLAGMKSWPTEWMPEGSNEMGWLDWYFKYNDGTRTDDDERQIKRWRSFKARHLAQFLDNPTPRRAYALRMWGIDPVKYLPENYQEPFQETMDLYKNEHFKEAKENVVHPHFNLLQEAKSLSDVKKYGHKTAIIKTMMTMSPDDWVIDSPEEETGYAGVTHIPTGFKLHIPRKSIPPVIKIDTSFAKSPAGHTKTKLDKAAIEYVGDVRKEIIGDKQYPFNYFTGETKEFLDELLHLNPSGIKEEFSDMMYAGNMMTHKLTGLNHPMLGGGYALDKFRRRNAIWKKLLEDEGLPFDVEYLSGGSNYARPAKIKATFALAGKELTDDEALHLTDKALSMEKEANEATGDLDSFANLVINDAKRKGWSIENALTKHIKEYEEDPSPDNWADIVWLSRANELLGNKNIPTTPEVPEGGNEALVSRVNKLYDRLLNTGSMLNPKSYVYHGSPLGDLSELKPAKHKAIEDEAAVFGTPDKAFALAMSIPDATISDIAAGYETDNTTGIKRFVLDELVPGALDKLKNKAYLYRVSGDFKPDPRLMDEERISTSPAKIMEKEEIENVYDALTKLNVLMRSHKDIPKSKYDGSEPDYTNLSMKQAAVSALTKRAIVEQHGDKWVLLTKDRSRVLGTHDTAEDAYKQEYAIQISKKQHAKKADFDMEELQQIAMFLNSHGAKIPLQASRAEIEGAILGFLAGEGDNPAIMEAGVEMGEYADDVAKHAADTWAKLADKVFDLFKDVLPDAEGEMEKIAGWFTQQKLAPPPKNILKETSNTLGKSVLSGLTATGITSALLQGGAYVLKNKLPALSTMLSAAAKDGLRVFDPRVAARLIKSTPSAVNLSSKELKLMRELNKIDPSNWQASGNIRLVGEQIKHKDSHIQLLEDIKKFKRQYGKDPIEVLQEAVGAISGVASFGGGAAAVGLNDSTNHLIDALYKKRASEIPGLPDREDYGDEDKLSVGELYDFVRQTHDAHRAGTHTDYRIGNPDIGLLSWASRKPMSEVEAGNKIELHRQPLHTYDYKNFEGDITEGYGAGTVKKEFDEPILITHKRPGVVSFSTTGKYPQRFNIIKTPDNKYIFQKGKLPEKHLTAKARYKDIHRNDIDEYLKNLKNAVVQAKVDGALAFLQMSKDKPEIISHRTSRVTGKPVVHTERFFNQRPHIKLPPELQDAVVKGELFAERDGKVLSTQDLGAILNSTLLNSIKKQKDNNIKLKMMPFDIASVAGEDMADIPYSERLKLLEKFIQHMPADKFIMPESAHTPEEYMALLNRIRNKEHPLTEEGIIIHPEFGDPARTKLFDETDVYIRDLFDAEPGSKYHAAGIPGGFTYSLEPEGPIVGRVGTGFSDELRSQLKDYIGRIARVQSHGSYPGTGALRAPSLLAIKD